MPEENTSPPPVANQYRPTLRMRVRNQLGKVVRRPVAASLRLASAVSKRLDLNGYMGKIINEVKPFGLDVFPIDDFYSPMPVLGRLKETKPRWCKPSEMVGVAYDLDAMRQDLKRLVETYGREWSKFDYKADVRKGFGPGFTEIDAMLLYMTVRDLKPKRYIEVGSGLSTYYATRANQANRADGSPAQMSCVDPYPFEHLRTVEGLQIIAKQVQDAELALFEQLEDGDVLVIDSTHIVTIDSDVAYLFMEVLPRLKKGVTVHVHDIPYPYNVPWPEDAYMFDRDWPWYFNEPMVLQAFLTYNDHFKITQSVPMLRHFDEPFVRNTIAGYDRILAGDVFPPCSVWIQRIK